MECCGAQVNHKFNLVSSVLTKNGRVGNESKLQLDSLWNVLLKKLLRKRKSNTKSAALIMSRKNLKNKNL